MSPLEQLTQKIIAAVPSIETYQREDITLEDVLIALGHHDYSVDATGTIYYLNDNYICDWLLNTPLHLQSEETVEAINKLIK